MSKQITFFDPRAIDLSHPNGHEITVTARTDEEYAATMAVILDPTREIPQDSIRVEDIPPTADEFRNELAVTDYKLQGLICRMMLRSCTVCGRG